jgi:Domain of unknown function (DUF4411)
MAGRPKFMIMDMFIAGLRAVSQWASSGAYPAAAVGTFLPVADYYLIAYAHAPQHIMVTHEVAAHGTKKIKIPTPGSTSA